ncbi:nascent polypeptide-associated complex protein [Candidatus Woesearchaeota archaeon]|nr:nascent polypeptide-associated complex protein [Candidatus Woesearchaeota archaeon]
MYPGVNPRQMQKMMRKMGISQAELPVTQVVMYLPDRRIVIDGPQVTKVNMMGQQTYQIAGAEREEPLEDEAADMAPSISDDDVRTVMEQAGCAEEDARAAIERAKGDLAQAIMDLSQE